MAVADSSTLTMGSGLLLQPNYRSSPPSLVPISLLWSTPTRKMQVGWDELLHYDNLDQANHSITLSFILHCGRCSVTTRMTILLSCACTLVWLVADVRSIRRTYVCSVSFASPVLPIESFQRLSIVWIWVFKSLPTYGSTSLPSGQKYFLTSPL